MRQQEGVNAANVLVVDFLVHHLLYFVVCFLIGCCDLFGYLSTLEVVNFLHKLTIVSDNALNDVCGRLLAVGVYILEINALRLVHVNLDVTRCLELTIADVNEVVGRFGKAAALGLLKDFLFVDNVDPVVVVGAPDPLRMVFNVRIVMATLSGTVVDADTV